MLLVTRSSQPIMLSREAPSSFIASAYCSECVPVVAAGGGVALVEVYKGITTASLVFMVERLSRASAEAGQECVAGRVVRGCCRW